MSKFEQRSNVKSMLSRISTRDRVGFKEMANMKTGLNSCYPVSAEVVTKGSQNSHHVTIKFENTDDEFVFDYLRTSNYARFERSFHRIKNLFKGTEFHNKYNGFDPIQFLEEPSSNQLETVSDILDTVVDEDGEQMKVIKPIESNDNITPDMSEEEIQAVYDEIANDLRERKAKAYKSGFEPIQIDNGSFGLFIFKHEDRKEICDEISKDINTISKNNHRVVLDIKKDEKGNLNVTKYIKAKA